MGKFTGLVKKPGALAPGAELERKRTGRPPGKRTNPDYDQFSVWLRKDVQRQARAQLLLTGGQDFSELVQSLVEEWLQKKKNT